MSAPEPPAGPTFGGPTADGPTPAGPSSSPLAAALYRLEHVRGLPLHEQPDVFQAVHTELQNALAAIDDA